MIRTRCPDAAKAIDPGWITPEVGLCITATPWRLATTTIPTRLKRRFA